MATMRPLHEQTLSNAQQVTKGRPTGPKMQHAFKIRPIQFNVNNRGAEADLFRLNEKITCNHDSAACTPHSTSGHLLDWAGEPWSPDQPLWKEVSL